jgi:DNA-binding MltR family transcriptional regulator
MAGPRIPIRVMSVDDPADDHAIAEIISERSDRGAAIVAVALVDERLRELIESRIHRDKRIWGDLFNNFGPLSSLFGKVTITFAFGILHKDICDDLFTIGEIRNQFAHHTLRTFSNQRIAGKVKNLKFSPRLHNVGHERGQFSEPDNRDRFMYSIQAALRAIRDSKNLSISPPTPPEPVAWREIYGRTPPQGSQTDDQH